MTEEVQSNSHSIEINSMMMMTSSFLSEALTTGISLDQLKLYCKYPMRYNIQLRKICREMYSLNGVFSNVSDYFVSAASLDFITLCTENTPANNKKRKLYNNMIYRLNHKLTTRDILLHCCIDGMYVGFLRDTKASNKDAQIHDYSIGNLDILDGLSIDDSIMIQPLNLDYCKIIGFQNNDYVVGFDMMYFNQFVGNDLLGEIKNYPPEFVKAYLLYKKDGAKRWFKLDQNKTVVLKFKSNISEPYGRSLAISALCDMFFSEQYTESQRANIIENAGTIRWLKQPTGEKVGACSLTQPQQMQQYENFKNAVISNTNGRDNRIGKTTTLVLAPGTEVGKLESNTNDSTKTLTDENIKKISTGLGFAAGALNGEGDSSYSSLAVNLNLILTQIYQVLEAVSWQFTKVFGNLVQLKGNNLIKFIYLKTSTLNKADEFAVAKDLFTLAGGSRLWLYAIGSGDVETYMGLMEYEKSMNFDEIYLPHQTSFTTTDNTGGRPTGDGNTESANRTKTNGSNKTPKPSTK